MPAFARHLPPATSQCLRGYLSQSAAAVATSDSSAMTTAAMAA
jgi:hypothetical protein